MSMPMDVSKINDGQEIRQLFGKTSEEWTYEDTELLCVFCFKKLKKVVETGWFYCEAEDKFTTLAVSPEGLSLLKQSGFGIILDNLPPSQIERKVIRFQRTPNGWKEVKS